MLYYRSYNNFNLHLMLKLALKANYITFPNKADNVWTLFMVILTYDMALIQNPTHNSYASMVHGKHYETQNLRVSY